MANKAVVSLAALGVGAYVVKEHLSDRLAQAEVKRREEEEADRAEVMLARFEEASRKKGGALAWGEQIVFHRAVYERVDDALFELVKNAGKSLSAAAGGGNMRRLDLPLLGDGIEGEDVMLAAALAIGDGEVLSRVVLEFTRQRLGIGLRKFSYKSIHDIIRELNKVEDHPISIDALNTFISITVGDSKFEPGSQKPVAAFLRKEFNKHYGQLVKHAERCGFHVTLYSSFRAVPRRNQRRNKGNKGLMLWTLDRRRHAENKRVTDVCDDEQIMIMNFLCNFEVPYSTDQDGYITEHYDNIRLACSGKHQNRLEPDMDEIASVFAQKLAARTAIEAARGLSRLCDGCGGRPVTHEHIAVSSGYTGDLLKTLAASDGAMLAKNRDKVASMLSDTLLAEVPPPKGKGADALAGEVSAFVTSYLQLIALTYCEVPEPRPSSFVPRFAVTERAKGGSIWKQSEMARVSISRTLVKEERERFLGSRMIVAPSKYISVALLLSVWATLSWLSTLGMRSLFYLLKMHVLTRKLGLERALGQVFAVWTMHSLSSLFKTYVFRLDGDSSHFDVLHCCTEFLHRKLALMRGRETPFDAELARVRQACKSQYRTWKLRIAKRDFNAALKRKRITCREAVFLLTEFADKHVERGNEEIISGELPVPLSEAEEFLRLRVEGQADAVEVSLSPEQSVENYLSTTSSNETKCSLERLSNLTEQIKSTVMFSEGDRVIVSDEPGHLVSPEKPEHNINSTALVSKRKQVGSVVFTTATLCFVQVDGEFAPIPIPVERCSHCGEDTDEVSDKDVGDAPAEHRWQEVGSDSDDESEVEVEEDLSEDDMTQPVADRPRTVEEALKSGGWKLVRSKKHIVYSRRARISSEDEGFEQNVVLAKTASDRRANLNSLALFRRLDEAMNEAVGPSTAGGSGRVVICSICLAQKDVCEFSKTQARKSNAKCLDCVAEAERFRAR